MTLMKSTHTHEEDPTPRKQPCPFLKSVWHFRPEATWGAELVSPKDMDPALKSLVEAILSYPLHHGAHLDLSPLEEIAIPFAF